MNAAIVTAVARHILTLFGGAMAARYGIDGGTIDGIIGALSTVAGLGWSIYDKRQRG